MKKGSPKKKGQKARNEDDEEDDEENEQAINLDDAIERLKYERAKHLKSLFVQTIKERYMKDSSFGMKQYK